MAKTTTPTGSRGLFFLDSGAHSLYTQEVIAKGHSDGYKFFKTKEFKQYRKEYAKYVKRNLDWIDYYVNIDVIFNPELSWENLKYLEGKGIYPIPVIHYGTDTKWVEKHLEEGYEFIGLGGLGQEVNAKQYKAWADRVFDILQPNKEEPPLVKTHGFAMTSYSLMKRYHWWSVDSASWTKAGSYGMIYVPRKRRGKFSFEVKPETVNISADSPSIAKGKHFLCLGPTGQEQIKEWLEKIGIELGTVAHREPADFTFGEAKPEMPRHEPGDKGALSFYLERHLANLRYFEALRKWLAKRRHNGEFRIFYSGHSNHHALPEVDLGKRANLMLTYWELHKNNGATVKRCEHWKTLHEKG